VKVIGGCYHEISLSPPVRQFYGSGGRAATALSLAGNEVELYTFVSVGAQKHVQRLAALSGFQVNEFPCEDEITFAYICPLLAPILDPPFEAITKTPNKIFIESDIALMFGMPEGLSSLKADTAIYDPQNSNKPAHYSSTNSTSKRLAILCNEREAQGLSPNSPWSSIGPDILNKENADVLVLKRGPSGLRVYTRSTDDIVPAYFADSIFSIGSGDMFAAAFSHAWAILDLPPVEAADFASRCVAWYVYTRQEGFVSETDRVSMNPAIFQPGRVYLAGPFFNMSQRLLVEQTRSALFNFGLDVFSPLHDVGHGPAEVVAPHDIRGLHKCDRVFAILDGLDAGTVFEIGYARKLGLPVYIYSELLNNEDCKMFLGTGCTIVRDYTTAIYHTAWKI
jgi:hypothetical protein